MGEALLGMGAQCEEEDPATPTRTETRVPAPHLRLGEGDLQHAESAPQLPRPLYILQGILFSKEERRKSQNQAN